MQVFHKWIQIYKNLMQIVYQLIIQLLDIVMKYESYIFIDF